MLACLNSRSLISHMATSGLMCLFKYKSRAIKIKWNNKSTSQSLCRTQHISALTYHSRLVVTYWKPWLLSSFFIIKCLLDHVGVKYWFFFKCCRLFYLSKYHFLFFCWPRAASFSWFTSVLPGSGVISGWINKESGFWKVSELLLDKYWVLPGCHTLNVWPRTDWAADCGDSLAWCLIRSSGPW